MASSYNIRPTNLTTTEAVYLVRHVSFGEQVNEVTLVSRTSDEPIAKISESDAYVFSDVVSGDTITAVRAPLPETAKEGAEAPAHLVIEGTKVRVSFRVINEETTELKNLADKQNEIRQNAIDARAAEKAMRAEAAEKRKTERVVRQAVPRASKREQLQKRIDVLSRRQGTQAADLEKTRENLKAAMDELSELDKVSTES